VSCTFPFACQANSNPCSTFAYHFRSLVEGWTLDLLGRHFSAMLHLVMTAFSFMSRAVVVLEVAESWNVTPINLKAECCAEFSHEPEARITILAIDVLSHQTILKRGVQL